jgi:glycerol-3-phosphate dehydrogenase
LSRPNLYELCKEKYDLLVVGGGINGAGIARDAALRGLRVLLVEKDDFGFGTSSRSTKLIHGGLRYLEHYEFSLVKESLRERWLLATKLAPHLVKPRSILFPVSEGDQRPPWMIRAGLFLYDLLAGRQNIGRHRWLNREAAVQAEPALNPEGLKSAGLFWDCQMNDARLCLENILAAEAAGAVCMNAVSMESAHGKNLGDIRVRLRDSESGSEAECRAGLMVNATGPWVDAVLGAAGLQGKKRIKASKGIHLVTRALTQNHALLAPSRSDNRIFFVIPWMVEGRALSLVGTTEGDFNMDMDHVRAEADEVDYLKTEVRRLLPGALQSEADVLGTYAGLRPLAAPLAEDEGHFKVSREAVIHVDEGIVSITGGKFTSYRQLAQDVCTRCEKLLAKEVSACTTADRALPGAGEVDLPGIEPGLADYLRGHYGSRAAQVTAIAQEHAVLKERIHPDHQTIFAQAVHAARHEKITSLCDFYLRRTFLGLVTPPDHSSASRVAGLIGKELGWDKQREGRELERLRRVVAGEYR